MQVCNSSRCCESCPAVVDRNVVCCCDTLIDRPLVPCGYREGVAAGTSQKTSLCLPGAADRKISVRGERSCRKRGLYLKSLFDRRREYAGPVCDVRSFSALRRLFPDAGRMSSVSGGNLADTGFGRNKVEISIDRNKETFHCRRKVSLFFVERILWLPRLLSGEPAVPVTGLRGAPARFDGFSGVVKREKPICNRERN